MNHATSFGSNQLFCNYGKLDVALGEYLSASEWNACYYAFLSGKYVSFGAAIQGCVADLLAQGYFFHGLDLRGHPRMRIYDSGNERRLAIITREIRTDAKEHLEMMDGGRSFLKKHCPRLVRETDAEWKEQVIEMSYLI